MTDRDILLFSYGTLQLESVQLSSFGRRLDGAVFDNRLLVLREACLAAAQHRRPEHYRRIVEQVGVVAPE